MCEIQSLKRHIYSYHMEKTKGRVNILQWLIKYDCNFRMEWLDVSKNMYNFVVLKNTSWCKRVDVMIFSSVKAVLLIIMERKFRSGVLISQHWWMVILALIQPDAYCAPCLVYVSLLLYLIVALHSLSICFVSLRRFCELAFEGSSISRYAWTL